MHSNRFLVLLLLVSAACTTPHKQGPSDDVASVAPHREYREIASSGPGMAYPAASSFKMSDIRGTTYITFLKEKLKPALDKLSDRKNGGGGGFKNIGADAYIKNSTHLDKIVHSKYRGAKWNRSSRSYEGALSEDKVEDVYVALKKIKPQSTVDSLTYFNREDKAWPSKNDMALALKEARINAAPFDLATLYALTSGFGVKVKIDDNNYNYHVLYMTGKTKPHTEVMSGRSFASSPKRGVGDATDPEYLRDLSKYLKETPDQKPFYKALILSIANSDPSGFAQLSALGQLVLGDFLTVYTAEAVRHLMVNLQPGMHPWEIDLAAVTFVSTVSSQIGQVVTDGSLVNADLGAWFAPSKNNVEGGPQRSGIGITRKDRKKFQQNIHAYEMTTKDGKEIIGKIQAIVGTKYYKNDAIQAVFEYLSSAYTPRTMGPKAVELANLMAQYAEMIRGDAQQIAQNFK